jgi:hypothetical protein
MKSLKLKIIGLLMVAIVFSAGILKADNNEPSAFNNLKVQVQKEVVDVLNTPVWLNFQDKNLNGESNVILIVEENGKISLKSTEGENNALNTMVSNKIKTLNLWADTKYAGKTFSYKIVSNQD